MKDIFKKNAITALLVVIFLTMGTGILGEQNVQAASVAPDVEDTQSKVAYLTFDDGPYREITPYILDILRQEGISATFFVLPFSGVDDIYWRIINEGHELGNHTVTHNFRLLYDEPIEVFADEVTRAHEFILRNFGYRMISFRFPGGPYGRPASIFDERREIVSQMGYREFSWHIDSGDSRAYVRNRGAGELVRRVLDYTEGREHLIILFHDVSWSPMTLEALPYIIAGLREQGYTFDVVRNFPFSIDERTTLRGHQETRMETEWSNMRRFFVAKNLDWLR